MLLRQIVRTALLGAVLLFMLGANSAQAGLILTLDPPVDRTAAIGEPVFFTGTIFNDSPATYTEVDLFLSFGFPLELLPGDELLSNSFTLNPGDTSASLTLFSMTLQPSAVIGTTYHFDASVSDGADTSPAALGSVTAVPEPASATLLLSGVTLLALRLRRKN
jgi:hypothetical protein